LFNSKTSDEIRDATHKPGKHWDFVLLRSNIVY
jgi:hypothetical protein